MTVYLDGSAILRHLLGQPSAVDIRDMGRPVSSELVRVECLRTLDRLRIREAVPTEEHLQRLESARVLLGTVSLADMDSVVLERATGPLLSPLTTLDAIHLVTALLLRDGLGEPFRLVTHDRALAMAARLHGISVVGA